MYEYTDTMYSHKLSYCTIQQQKKKRKEKNKVSLPWLVIPIYSAGKFWVSHRKRFQESALLSPSVVKSFKHIHKDKSSSAAAAAAAAAAVGAGGSLAALRVVLLY